MKVSPEISSHVPVSLIGLSCMKCISHWAADPLVSCMYTSSVRLALPGEDRDGSDHILRWGLGFFEGGAPGRDHAEHEVAVCVSQRRVVWAPHMSRPSPAAIRTLKIRALAAPRELRLPPSWQVLVAPLCQD